MIKQTIIRALGGVPLDRRNFGWFRGRDFSRDIAVTCPATEVQTVFDVGAFVGDESRRFLRTWPHATVYAFEPTPETFRILSQRLRHPRCRPQQLAISSSAGTARFVAEYMGSSNRLVENRSTDTIDVAKTTLDVFCEQKGISAVDVLKIDTEGHEMEVLKGASNLLSHGRIGFLRAECGVDPANDRHVPFHQLADLLLGYGYRIFGVYDQENEFFRQEPQLRRFDLAFISPSEVDRNRGVARRWPKTMLDWVVALKNRS